MFIKLNNKDADRRSNEIIAECYVQGCPRFELTRDFLTCASSDYTDTTDSSSSRNTHSRRGVPISRWQNARFVSPQGYNLAKTHQQAVIRRTTAEGHYS